MKQATHEHLASHRAQTESSPKTFGLLFCGIFVAIGLYQLWLLNSFSAAAWLTVAAAFGAAAMLAPQALAPLTKAWLKLGALLHKIVSPLILGLLFFGIFTPVAFIARLTGYDPLRTRGGKQTSYWITREPGPKADSLGNQF